MKNKGIVILIFLFFSSCMQKGKNEDSILNAYIGNIKISKFVDSNTFCIYVSSMIINHSNDEYFIDNDKSVIGIIENDTIQFDHSSFPLSKIKPNDTSICYYSCNYYLPTTDEKSFIESLKCIDLYMPVSKNDTIITNKNDIYLNIERTDSSKIVILRNDSYEDGVFVFGIYEFYPHLIDTTRASYDKSTVTGEYIKEVCP